MDYNQIEKDIQHLEHVINRISVLSCIPLSLSYWRNRVDTVLASELVPSQALRVKRIQKAIYALDEPTTGEIQECGGP